MLISMVWPALLTSGGTWSAATASVARDETGRATLVSPGAVPFTDSWAQMEAQDARAGRAGAMATAPEGVPAIPPSFPGSTQQDTFDVGGASPSGISPLSPFFPPPDTMGAIGPNHFLQTLNGLVAVYSRSGQRLRLVSSQAFFALVSGGVRYPRSSRFFGSRAVDPRVLYDPRSGRWFASTLEYNNGCGNQVLLGVSRSADPLGVWDKYVIPVADAGRWTDFDTLGVDDNGVYFGVDILPTNNLAPLLPVCIPDFSTVLVSKVAATRKASLLASNPSLGPVFTFLNPSPFQAPLPAVNHDAAKPSDPAWIRMTT